MPYKDPKARKKCTQNHRNRRNELLSQFKCVACNECDPDLIDWHHVNPSEKLFNIRGTSVNENDWWSEVLKCIPVCCNCHRKIHKDKLCLLPVHL